MKMLKSPRCRGSNRQLLGVAGSLQKRATCSWCHNIVAVRNGRLVEHWWSRRAHRYTSSKYKRSNQ